MSRKQRRLFFVLILLLGAGVSTALAMIALKDNVSYFHTPSDIIEHKMTEGQRARAFRLGGMVVKGSWTKDGDGLTYSFRLSDMRNEMTVVYKGIPPDLFREGQGVIAEGQLQPDGVFAASNLLAKHDEKYMPPEITKSLNEQKAQGAPIQ